ncbi:coiled-coil domain-containing protein [Helicobacter ailurogastricus]|uniref:hypothetical protein n=1 Tax=Helicobacter ailurogastricus TaxID=1578720 RepID=UPI0018F81D75|nr:hypothetical protein [Helicobacter ailurogastricus]
MGNIASINFKPTNAIQLEHNDRTRPPTYLLVNKGLDIECPIKAQEALAKREQLIAQAKATYEKKFNQPFKATDYLYSAVVNLKETTTMADLEKLSQHFKAHYGFQCYQIAIHRDEGHIDKSTGQTCINHHAHMEFVMLHPDTGKSLMRKISKDGEPFKSKRKAYEQIQTEVAEILGMERGQFKNNQYDDEGNLITKGTYRKRIEPRAYARLMQEQADPLRAQIAQLQATQAQEHQALNSLCQQIAPSQEPQLLSFNECKQIIEAHVKEWIAINKELGDNKLYTPQDYRDLRALKLEGISITDLKANIANLEQKIQDRQTLLDRQAPSSQDRQRLKYYSREKLIDTCISYDNQRIMQEKERADLIKLLDERQVFLEQMLKANQETAAMLRTLKSENRPIGAKELDVIFKKISEMEHALDQFKRNLNLGNLAHQEQQALKIQQLDITREYDPSKMSPDEYDPYEHAQILAQENASLRKGNKIAVKEKNKMAKELASLKKQLASSQTAPTQELQKSTTR